MNAYTELNNLRENANFARLKQLEAELLIKCYAEDNDLTYNEALTDIESCADLLTEEYRYAYTLITNKEFSLKMSVC